MSTTEIILEILKYTLPAGMVLAAMVLLQREQFKKVQLKERYQMYQKSYSEMLPLRLQAYERAILFLERITPENLILRLDGQGKTVAQFQGELLAEVRAEYDHNVAQQLYISAEGWARLARSKDQVMSLINQTARSLPPDAAGTDLGRKILNQMVAAETLPTREAVDTLKSDIQRMFRY